jgi:hypothetical protein
MLCRSAVKPVVDMGSLKVRLGWLFILISMALHTCALAGGAFGQLQNVLQCAAPWKPRWQPARNMMNIVLLQMMWFFPKILKKFLDLNFAKGYLGKRRCFQESFSEILPEISSGEPKLSV